MSFLVKMAMPKNGLYCRRRRHDSNPGLVDRDRNFCVLEFLFKIDQKSAFFVIRQHGSTPLQAIDSTGIYGEIRDGGRV